jgi:hypothetical protein
MKKKLEIDSPLRAATCSRLADLVKNLRGAPGITIGDQWKSRTIADDIESVMAERDAFRDALKQIVHNPGWQDPEVGFMSGHIAAAALNQYPENA